MIGLPDYSCKARCRIPSLTQPFALHPTRPAFGKRLREFWAYMRLKNGTAKLVSPLASSIDRWSSAYRSRGGYRFYVRVHSKDGVQRVEEVPHFIVSMTYH